MFNRGVSWEFMLHLDCPRCQPSDTIEGTYDIDPSSAYALEGTYDDITIGIGQSSMDRRRKCLPLIHLELWGIKLGKYMEGLSRLLKSSSQ